MSFYIPYIQSIESDLDSFELLCHELVKNWKFIVNIIIELTDFLYMKSNKLKIEQFKNETISFYNQFKQYSNLYTDHKKDSIYLEDLYLIELKNLDYCKLYKDIFDIIKDKIENNLLLKKEHYNQIDIICENEHQKLIYLLNKYELIKQNVKKEKELIHYLSSELETIKDELIEYKKKFSKENADIENIKTIKKALICNLLESNTHLQAKKKEYEKKILQIDKKLVTKSIQNYEYKYKKLITTRTKLNAIITFTYKEINYIQKELAVLEKQVIKDNYIKNLQNKIKNKTKRINKLSKLNNSEHVLLNLKDEINKCKDSIQENELLFLKKEEEINYDQDIISNFYIFYNKYNIGNEL